MSDEVVVATGNRGKLAEIEQILSDLPVRLLALDAFPDVAMPEEGDDYEENARHKALTVARATGRIAIGDDSGLEVAGLGGRPGPRSARYGGPGLDDVGRVEHLLEEMASLEGAARDARFVCVAAVASPQGASHTAFGECRGRILSRRVGSGGFGYDPVFESSEAGVSMAELSAARKNELSHRARAFRALAPRIEALLRA
jgi:XTP/dITP diphosphohydrolase